MGGGEIVALVGGALLALALFLKWFGADASNPNAKIDAIDSTVRGGSVSAWQVFPVLRILLLLAALAPFVLLFIALRNAELSWPRGEATAVIAIFTLGLVFYNGIVTRPGSPRAEISLQLGYYLALLAAIIMTIGAAQRSTRSQVRKPPGV